MSVEVTNRNGPAVTPPTSLSLRSSHNQLLSSDVIKQGSATPPKCRKKYALTSIQAAMGLGENAPPSASPSSSSPSQSVGHNNPKLAKNGANQLRKAGHDHNKNTTDPTDPECNPEPIADDPNVNTVEEHDSHSLTNEQKDVSEMDVEERPGSTGDAGSEQKTESDADCNTNWAEETKLNGNTADLVFDLNVEVEEPDDICILSEKEIPLIVNIEEDGVAEELEDNENKPLLKLKTDSPMKEGKVSSGSEIISKLQSNLTLLQSEKTSGVPPPVSPPRQGSPEDTPLLSAASCPSSSSSSPETKKDRRTGAKTDCALNRIQNLNPSDEELSWTTLSQDSNSPEETGIHTDPESCCKEFVTLNFTSSVAWLADCL